MIAQNLIVQFDRRRPSDSRNSLNFFPRLPRASAHLFSTLSNFRLPNALDIRDLPRPFFQKVPVTIQKVPLDPVTVFMGWAEASRSAMCECTWTRISMTTPNSVASLWIPRMETL
jgi:hypothetical protein